MDLSGDGRAQNLYLAAAVFDYYKPRDAVNVKRRGYAALRNTYHSVGWSGRIVQDKKTNSSFRNSERYKKYRIIQTCHVMKRALQ